MHLEAAAGTLHRTARVGSLRAPGVDAAETVALAGRHLVGTYYTHPYGNLSLDVGLTRAAARAAQTKGAEVGEGALTVTGLLPQRANDAPVLRLTGPADAIEAKGTATDGRFTLTLTADVLRGLSPGTWRVALAWGEASVPVTPASRLSVTLRSGAKEIGIAVKGGLEILVTELSRRTRVKRVLKRSGFLRKVADRFK